MNYTPRGWNTITPRLFVRDVKGLVKFLRKMLRATGRIERSRPTVLRIGDSQVMISDAEVRGAAAAFLYVYVDDVDRTYQRALRAGAKSIEQPQVMPYGDRRAMVKDRWGNVWQIATYGRPAG